MSASLLTGNWFWETWGNAHVVSFTKIVISFILKLAQAIFPED